MNPSTTTSPTESRLGNPPLSRPSAENPRPQSDGGNFSEEKKAAMELKETVRQKGHEAAEQIRDRTEETLREARAKGTDMVARQKDKAAQRLSEYEKALKAAASKLHEGHDDHLSPYVEQAADQLGRLSGYLTAKEPGDLFEDAERFARRNPEIVMGACVVAGLALGRFLKASRRTNPTSSNYNEAGYNAAAYTS